MDSEIYYKLQSICTLKDKSKEECVREIIQEKIMNMDVVKYVEELSKSDINKKSYNFRDMYSKESINIKKDDLDTETAKRLTIFAGAYKKPKESYDYDPISDIASELFNEKIEEINLIELVKDEYGN